MYDTIVIRWITFVMTLTVCNTDYMWFWCRPWVVSVIVVRITYKTPRSIGFLNNRQISMLCE